MKIPFTGIKVADKLFGLKMSQSDHMEEHGENILKNLKATVSGIKAIKHKNAPVTFESSEAEFHKKYRVFTFTYAVSIVLMAAATYASSKIGSGSSLLWDVMSITSLAYGSRLFVDCMKVNAHCRLLIENWSRREEIYFSYREFAAIITKRPALLLPEI